MNRKEIKARAGRLTNLKHILSRILLIVALSGTRPLKVIKQSSGVLADITKVDCLTSFGKKQKAIEFLEQDSGRLMDR